MNYIILFITHFLFDFVFQSREMGQKKSKEIKYLLKHGGILFVGYMWAAYAICNRWNDMLIMSGIIVIIHCIQDWYIWRAYKWSVRRRLRNEWSHHLHKFPTIEPEAWFDRKVEKYKYWEDHIFYATIGLDQTLHFITIVLIYNWVM